MLSVFYGSMEGVISDPSSYFDFSYEEEWITDPLVEEMIRDVDKSEVLYSGVIDSPVLGKISPRSLSCGVKALILMKFLAPGKVVNASHCGDNCAKWILKIGKEQDLTVNLRHMMDFGGGEFAVRVLNTGHTVHSMNELAFVSARPLRKCSGMTESHRVMVQSRRVRYDFVIRGKITIVRGDSGTGKTLLIYMLSLHERDGDNSAVEVVCDRPCVVLDGPAWKEQLSETKGSIVFIDDTNAFVSSPEFSSVVGQTDNCYVIVMREDLPGLSYGDEEIYGIRRSERRHSGKKTYNEFYQMYPGKTDEGDPEDFQ